MGLIPLTLLVVAILAEVPADRRRRVLRHPLAEIRRARRGPGDD